MRDVDPPGAVRRTRSRHRSPLPVLLLRRAGRAAGAVVLAAACLLGTAAAPAHHAGPAAPPAPEAVVGAVVVRTALVLSPGGPGARSDPGPPAVVPRPSAAPAPSASADADGPQEHPARDRSGSRLARTGADVAGLAATALALTWLGLLFLLAFHDDHPV